jgi:hypothetical protein
MSDVVQKLWGFCPTLRHDDADYEGYNEQGTDRDTSTGGSLPSDENP